MARKPAAAEAEQPVEEAQQPSDEEIQAAIDAEIAAHQAQAALNNKAPELSIQTIFSEAVALVSAAVPQTRRNREAGTPKLSEANAVKLFELSLFWYMNSRQQGFSPELLTQQAAPVEPPMEVQEEINGDTSDE